MTTYVLATRNAQIIVTLPDDPKAELALLAIAEEAAKAEKAPQHDDLLAELEALASLGVEIDVVEGSTLGEVDWLDIGAKPPEGFKPPDPMDQSDLFDWFPSPYPIAQGGVVKVHTNYDFSQNKIIGKLVYHGDGSVVTIDNNWKVTGVVRTNENGSVSEYDPVYGEGDQKDEIVTWRVTHKKNGRVEQTEEHNSDGSSVDTLYDSEGRISSRRTEDADGTVTYEEFDEKGNVTSRIVVSTEQTEDGKTVVTTKTYDGDGKLISEKTEDIEPKGSEDDDTTPVEPGADGGPSALSDTAKEKLEKAGSGPGPNEEEILTDPDAEAKGDLPDSAEDTPGPDAGLILVDPDTILFIFTELPDLDTFDPAYGRTQPDPTDDPEASEVEPPAPVEGTDFTDDAFVF
ncbi:MAG: hypothetical protein AAGH68_10650 [Pseudomonadota bacterium]